MSCSRPFHLDFVTDYLNRLVDIPCGTCMNCRRDKVRMLELRANEEWKSHQSSAYITLTFDDNHIRSNFGFFRATVSKKDVHEFFDRLRHNLKNIPAKFVPHNVDMDFSYLYATEYGEDRGRPHVHLILFGVDFATCRRLLQRTWENGSIDIKPVKNGCIRYVAKYLGKQLNGEAKELSYTDNGLDAPCVGWSKSFGAKFFDDHASDIAKYGAIKDGNNFLPVPSYYKNKYYFYDVDNIDNHEFEKQQRKSREWSVAKFRGFNSWWKYLQDKRTSSELMLFNKAISRREEINLIDYAYFVNAHSRLCSRPSDPHRFNHLLECV